MRKNGFEKPFDGLQLLTWTFFPILVGGFYGFSLPPLDALSFSIPLGILYGLLSASALYSAGTCTSINPIDQNIGQTNEEEMNHLATDDQIFCHVCNKYVDKNSRHCRICDKCVATFDHHCTIVIHDMISLSGPDHLMSVIGKWLNNCIGEKNYTYFFSAMVSMAAMAFVQLSVGIYWIVLTFVDSDALDRRMSSTYGCTGPRLLEHCASGQYRLSRGFFVGFQIAYACILAPILYMILQLLVFHMRLRYEGITTYEYIVRTRKRKLQRLRNRADGQETIEVDEPLPFWGVLCCRQKTPPPTRLSSSSSRSSSCSNDKPVMKDKPKEEEPRKEIPLIRGFGVHLNHPEIMKDKRSSGNISTAEVDHQTQDAPFHTIHSPLGANKNPLSRAPESVVENV